MSKKGRGGRPSKYDPKYHPQLVKWMARCGKTQAEIAEELEISEPTLYAWAKKYPDFLKSLKESGGFIDSLVEDSLLKRALGYQVEEVEITETTRKDGTVKERVKRTVKYVDPHPTAIIYWLNNRQPERWRNRVEVDTEDKKEIRVIVGMEGLTDETEEVAQ
jgi:transposase-like protein